MQHRLLQVRVRDMCVYIPKWVLYVLIVTCNLTKKRCALRFQHIIKIIISNQSHDVCVCIFCVYNVYICIVCVGLSPLVTVYPTRLNLIFIIFQLFKQVRNVSLDKNLVNHSQCGSLRRGKYVCGSFKVQRSF